VLKVGDIGGRKGKEDMEPVGVSGEKIEENYK